MHLKGVLIDLGNTLTYISKRGRRKYEVALLATMRRYGYQGNLEELASVFDGLIGNSMKGEFEDIQEFWCSFIQNLKDLKDQARIIEELEIVREKYSAGMFQLYDGGFQVLNHLKSKYKLALVSNCAIGTYEVIKSLGLSNFFECIILSYKIGTRKPDRRMYAEALQCLELGADECIFVADEISDLEGAKRIGMQTLLLRQGSSTFREAKDPNFKPDFQCCRISEITEIL